jgi:hypothetical protein
MGRQAIPDSAPVTDSEHSHRPRFITVYGNSVESYTGGHYDAMSVSWVAGARAPERYNGSSGQPSFFTMSNSRCSLERIRVTPV